MLCWSSDVEKGTPVINDHQSGPGPPEDSNPTSPMSSGYTTTRPQTPQGTLKKQTPRRPQSCVSLRSFSHVRGLRLSRLPTSRRQRAHARQINVEPIVRKIHEQPRGYPKLATFLDCDDVFMIYRRFGYIQSRLLLEKQDDLAQLELKLQAIEMTQFREDDKSLTTRRDLYEECMANKRTVLKELEQTWNEYCTLVTNASKMVSMNKPTSTEHRSVAQFITNTRPLTEPEDHFIRHRDDLITLRPGREHAWLDAGIEKVLKWSRSKIIRGWFQSEDTVVKSDGSDGVTLYTRSRIEKCVLIVITIMILVLLVVPVYLLYILTLKGSDLACIGVLVVATLACSASTSLFTCAKRYEILMASAAYCAVLVVFIGNIDDRSRCNSTSSQYFVETLHTIGGTTLYQSSAHT